jgi:hypothetical protein
MTSSHICHKPAHYIMTFFHIRHRWINPLWRSIKFIVDEEPIVQSALAHLLYFAYLAWINHVGPTCQICTEKTFFGYQNIILCHLSGPHASSAWTDFFKWNSKCWKQGLNPQPHGHWKHISLGYCFIFVVVQVIISLYYPLCIDSVQSAW